MPRPTATAVLLVGAAVARATAVALAAPTGDVDVRTLVLALDVLVPAAVAAADLRGIPGAAPAAVALGSLGAGTLLSQGVLVLAGEVALTPVLGVFLAASMLAMLAGAAVIGRWQDAASPPAGSGALPLRVVALAATLALAAVLVTRDVAVLGVVPVAGGALPGPVGIATTIDLRRLPLLLGVLLPMAWAATRAGVGPLRAVALVLGARAVLEAVADATLLGLGAPQWPTIAGTVAALTLLLVVPWWAQATSSSA